MNYIELSKEVSYALRHAPQEYGLYLDEHGWVSTDLLIAALKKKKFKDLSYEDLMKMVNTAKKKRHEIQNGRIRALYGHSVGNEVIKETIQPPDILYHGTAHKFMNKILEEGLIPKNRQFVHLSENVEMAYMTGKRRDVSPVIFKIHAKEAWNEGISFYLGNEKVWLSNAIPSKFLVLLDQ